MSWLTGFLGNLAGNVLGKFASSAIDSHYSGQVIDRQLNAQKELFEFENRNKHQFEVEDLKAAGLNPILSATNGNAIGVGGVSAPNWTSDDDIFSPSAARALQEKQISVQDTQAKAAAMNAEAAMIQAHNGQVSSSAKANLDNTSAEIAWMKADAEIQTLYKGLAEKDANIKYLSGKFEEAIASALEHRSGAKDKLESAIGRNISNSEEKFVLDLLRDPNLEGTPTKTALILAKGLKLNTSERVALVAAITGHRFRPKYEKNESSSSAVSAYDDFVKYNVD